ncbi:matrix [Connecticut virus]|uniref:Matrix n=1 Tax=Connecticut virus TaxID=1272962 RepID=A0A0D3R1M9_9RHAB|nr:matrix [Connecticut virus]AJR28563.1 matrix [Connecticut virus]
MFKKALSRFRATPARDISIPSPSVDPDWQRATSLLSSITQDTPSPPPPPPCQELYVELYLKISLTADGRPHEHTSPVAALRNWPLHYTGEYDLRHIWMTFALVGACNLEILSEAGTRRYYSGLVHQGIGLKVKTDKMISIGRKRSWNQTMKIDFDGVSTVWTFSGRMEPTLIPYRLRAGSPEIVSYLQAMWINAEEEDGHLVIHI